MLYYRDMSTKGKQLAETTRQKISISKTKHTKADLIQKGIDYIQYLNDNPKELPALSGYCLAVGMHRSSLLEYRAKYPEVDDIARTIELAQEHYALTRGITNRANPIFSMFLLKGKHGYQEQPTQLTQNNNFNISPDLLADALKLMNSDDK